MEQSKPVNFSLNSIFTLQFAILEEYYRKGGEVDLTTAVNFGIVESDFLVASRGVFTFSIEQKPFLKLEVACYFKIDETSWSSFVLADRSSIVFPRGLLMHLTTIMIGTARGVLHAKTENTEYNQFPLPTINVTELVTEDVAISLEK